MLHGAVYIPGKTIQKLDATDVLYGFYLLHRGHRGVVVTHSPPTASSEVGSLNPRPYVGKLVLA